MKITVIGTDYVGLVAGVGFAKWGNDVVCLDVIEEKIGGLQNGICPIYVPGATTQLREGLSSGRLRFTTNTAEEIRHGTLIFIAVSTPEQEEGGADLRYVEAATDEIADLCEAVGADALQVAAAMGKDGRISPTFLHPGPGYGGSCFPKDTKALDFEELGQHVRGKVFLDFRNVYQKGLAKQDGFEYHSTGVG